MSKDKGRELTKRELHIEFGQECALGRRYNVWSGQRYDSPYIYENDDEMKARFDRIEELEWEEQYKKKCQKMLDEKNK